MNTRLQAGRFTYTGEPNAVPAFMELGVSLGRGNWRCIMTNGDGGRAG